MHVPHSTNPLQTSGWLIHVERDVSFDPSIPAFFAAYELTERITTWLDVCQFWFYTAFFVAALIGVAASFGFLYRALRG